MTSVTHRVSMRAIGLWAALLVAGCLVAMPSAQAQQRTDTTKTDTARVARPGAVGAPMPAPTVPAQPPVQPPVQAVPSTLAMRGKAPISSRRAFLYSLMLPGLGQAKLDRGTSGALFSSVELAALVMLRRTAANVREARRYLTDTIPEHFTVQQSGTEIRIEPSGTIVGPYTSDIVRTRRLHAEDWIAVIAFNHLFSGADAFVSAQLWDMPLQLSAAPTTLGPMFVVSLRF